MIGSSSGTITLGQSWPGSNGNEGVLCFPQSSSITGASPSDSLVSYPGHLLEGVLPLCREAVSVFYSPQPTGQRKNIEIAHSTNSNWIRCNMNNAQTSDGERNCELGKYQEAAAEYACISLHNAKFQIFHYYYYYYYYYYNNIILYIIINIISDYYIINIILLNAYQIKFLLFGISLEIFFKHFLSLVDWTHTHKRKQ